MKTNLEPATRIAGITTHSIIEISKYEATFDFWDLRLCARGIRIGRLSTTAWNFRYFAHLDSSFWLSGALPARYHAQATNWKTIS
jgi:hypothetical protein